MRSFSILLVALVATVELGKGAALEKGDTQLPEMMKPATPVNCQLTPSLCGGKKPEVESEIAEKPAATPPVGCTGTASECEMKKREVKPVRGGSRCGGLSSLCGFNG